MLLVSAKRPVTRLRGMVPRWDAGPTVSSAGGHGTTIGQTKYQQRWCSLACDYVEGDGA